MSLLLLWAYRRQAAVTSTQVIPCHAMVDASYVFEPAPISIYTYPGTIAAQSMLTSTTSIEYHYHLSARPGIVSASGSPAAMTYMQVVVTPPSMGGGGWYPSPQRIRGKVRPRIHVPALVHRTFYVGPGRVVVTGTVATCRLTRRIVAGLPGLPQTPPAVTQLRRSIVAVGAPVMTVGQSRATLRRVLLAQSQPVMTTASGDLHVHRAMAVRPGAVPVVGASAYLYKHGNPAQALINLDDEFLMLLEVA